MDSQRMLDEFSERTGWNTQAQLDLMCEYVDRQLSPEAFRDFLQHNADQEQDVIEDEDTLVDLSPPKTV
jgi:hypothetical protein